MKDVTKKELFELEQVVENLRAIWPNILEFQKVRAELYFNKYKELQSAGFTKDEALTLCAQSKDFY